MLMDKGLDTGPILKIAELPLRGTETVENLHDDLAKLGAETLPQILIELSEGKISPQPQEGPSTYVKEIKKEDGKIDWSKPAKEIERMIRAYTPWPGVYSQLAINNWQSTKTLKILSADNEVLPTDKYQIGEILLINDKLAIQCGDGAIIATRLQLEGGKALEAAEFLNGHRDMIGKILK
jgi:methionyl-tRNA formyltransferase